MKTMRWLLLAGVLAVAACGKLADFSGGPYGATPGGTQDMTFARELVEQGMVPPPEAFLVEGMFSEHDLPIDADGSCSELLCLSAATAVAPNANHDVATWVQLGMSSTITPETLQRPSLAAVFVIDVSGSMGYEYPGSSNGGTIAKALASAIATQLDEGDSVAIVTFDTNARTVLDWTVATDESVQAAIDALASGGSTNMEAGMQLGFSMAREAPVAQATRVFLLTDAQPNVGSTSQESFHTQVRNAAEAGIGLTVFGTALGLNVELMDFMSQTEGGNAFTLTQAEAVEGFMNDNWPFLTMPLAYDLNLAIAPTQSSELVHAYGFPGTDPEDLELDVATVFLSKNRGALLLELTGELEGCGADLSLSYRNPDGSITEDALTAAHDGSPLDEDDEYYPQGGVHKTVALALLVDGMRTSADQYENDHDQAVATLSAVLERFTNEASEINDPDIDAEADFWPKLLELMQAGADQGNYYPN